MVWPTQRRWVLGRGVLVSDVPWRRDAAQLGERIGAWAARVIGAHVTVDEVTAPEGTGMSSETVLFSLTGGPSGAADRYVARLAPDPSVVPVFPVYDFELQQRCMDLVRAETTVPTPTAPWYEPDPSWLGTPFLVMGRIAGVAPPDIPPYVLGGWLFDTSGAERSIIEANATDVLVRLHALNPQDHDLAFLDRPEHGTTAIDQHLGYQRWYYDWARQGVVYPLIERAFDWLEDNRPLERPAVLNWGDARIGNILWRGTEVSAVLDWEMAALGPAEVDVAWMIWLHRFFQSLAESYGAPGLPGFLDRARVIALYERASGRGLDDLRWYEVFAATRHAIITVRTMGRTIAFGTRAAPADPDDLINFRDLLEQMLEGRYWQ
jgi:aminoglycoside phosphotransferase (APT) family kinase protein